MSETLTLMALWSRNKHKCRPIGQIVTAARDGQLPGIKEAPSGFGYLVTNETAALAAMRKS